MFRYLQNLRTFEQEFTIAITNNEEIDQILNINLGNLEILRVDLGYLGVDQH